MVLASPRFRDNARLQLAAGNSPPLRWGTEGDHVRLVQQGLMDLGYALPVSTKRYGSPDGIYGGETIEKVRAFQLREHLGVDGTVGRFTMHRLDALLPAAGAPLPPLPKPHTYIVPGLKVVIAQPTSMICWATVHCMMRSWRDQASYDIREAADRVASKYATLVDQNKGLPPSEFGPFIAAAGMVAEPMANYLASAWEDMLRTHGLLWVGTLNSLAPGAGLHSRIIEGMSGHGENGREMFIIDPDGGRRYRESFEVFVAKYEGAIAGVTGQYLQIRHF